MTTINTMTAWQPFKRPIAAAVIAAQLALVLQPLGALAQAPGPTAAPLYPGQQVLAQAPLQTAPPTSPSPAKATAQTVKATAQASTSRPAAPLSGDVASQDLEQSLRIARQLVAQLQDPASTANAAQRGEWTQQLRQSLNTAISSTAALRLSLFTTASDQGSGGPSSAGLATQAQQAFNTRADALGAAGKAWLANPSIGNLVTLAAFFAQYKDIGAAPAASHSQLPWGSLTKPRAPATTKTAAPAQSNLGAAQTNLQNTAQAITILAGLQFTTPPNAAIAAMAPTDADVAQTALVTLTPAIRAQAAALGNNPVNIENWVRSTIAFAPNAGVTQNAQTTLTALRGNASDIATLLIALLRAAGVPARYATGTIELPSAKAQNWLGGLQRPEAALSLLQQGGIAASAITAAGQITAIRMEHVWVEAYVNWTPSRGAKDGGWNLTPRQHPNPNANLNAWVPLDGAFKTNTISSGANLAELAPLNGAALLGSIKQGATCTPANASAISTTALTGAYSNFSAAANSQLTALGPNTSVAQILGTTSIAQRLPELLAGTLPYATVVANTPTAALAPSANWSLQMNLLNGLTPVLSGSSTLADLQGQNLSLAFVPATSADAATVAGLLRPSSGAGVDPTTGLPSRIPAYLAQFKAQLTLGGQVLAQGGSFTLGQSLVLRSVMTGPDGSQLSTDNTVVVGETHAWAVQGQAQGANASASVNAGLSTLRGQLQGGNLPAGPQQTAQTLSALASTYQALLDAKSRLYQSASGVVEVRLPSLVRASTRLEVDTALGLVTYVRPAGVGLHVDHLSSASVSQTGLGATSLYQQQSQERASASAHQLLDRLFGPSGNPAQSALSGLATAALQGQTILRADSTTAATVLARLNANSTLRTEIQNAVANGQQALFAQNPVDLGGPLAMEPLVLNDPTTGAASYTVNSYNAPLVQLTAQRPGLVGWLGLADAQASKTLLSPVIDATTIQLNTVQTLLGDWRGVQWQGFVGQAELLDGLFLSRISDAASQASITSTSGDACNWLVSTLASQLSRGLPDTARINRAPVITSTAPTSATLDQPYTYAVQATDPDGDALTYSLSGAPTGMAISASGTITWSRPVRGDFNLVVQVDDGRIAVQQAYVLSVTGAANGIQLNAQLNPSVADPGQPITLTVQATAPIGSNANVVLSATLDGIPLNLDANGIAHFNAPQAGAQGGVHRVLAKAQAGTLSASQEFILTVRDASAIPSAVATITSPQDDDSVKGGVTITGTATATKFAYYELKLRATDACDSCWTTLKRSLSPISNASLGQWDTTTVSNGQYQIALRVVDVNAVETLASVTVSVVSNLKLGQFHLSFTDVQAPATGLPLMLTRLYDTTRRTEAGDFGYGWSASAQDISVKKNQVFGLTWDVVTRQLQSCLIPVGKRRISITLPDGGLYRFDAKNDPECGFGQTPAVNITFTPVPGPAGGSVAGSTSASAQLKINDGVLPMAQGGILVDSDTGLVWNPLDFVLTTAEGFQYALHEGGGIQWVSDPYGNRVTYNPAGYTHSAGLSVSLTRDAQGRITSATDPNGKTITYSYSAQGDLSTVTDRAGGVTKFAYATDPSQPHLLVSITDPRGVVVMANQFDAQGRLTATADALGQATTQQFDTLNNTQTLFDRRGNKTVYTFDADGNITKLVNALGQTSTYTFDANGNELTTTNALGQTTTRTFDDNGHATSETNALGHTTRTGYLTAGAAYQRLNPMTFTDAKGNVTSYGYTAGEETQAGATPRTINEPLGRGTFIDVFRGNLRGMNVAGEAHTYGYDTQGRRTVEADGLGNAIRYTFDANGNQTSQTVTKTINGAQQSLTTTNTYDAQNRLVAVTDPLGGVRTMEYNSADKLISQTDSLGQKTTYTYDGNARLISTQYSDGTSESTGFDGNGNESSKTDRAGRTTTFTYDVLDRLVKTTYPDGSTETITFDAAGRVTAATDRKGQRSSVEWDAAGRQTASTDATGIRTTQTYDANGNRTGTTTDGRTTTFTYDALNRLTATRYPDGSSFSTVYRTDSRKQSETDARGLTTSYGYDVAGRLTSVTQSLSGNSTATTAYNYDETGAKTTQTDALNRTTTWSMDAGGRITSRKLQDGTTERNSYDLEGKRISHTSFAGEQLTFQYDTLGQLTGAIVPAGRGTNSDIAQSSVLLGYTPSGQVASQQEQGATTLNGMQTYRYNANDQLIQTTSPLGQLGYTLDANGRVLERSVSNPTSDAGTTTSTYDAAGRLATVKAPDGKQTRYSYDAAGRLILTERDLNPVNAQAQVLRTHQRYDAADRVVAIAHVKQTGATQTLMVGQALTRDAGGAVIRIDMYRTGFGATPASFDANTGTFSGTVARSQSFEFDANARLTRENRVDAATPTLSQDTRYTYDAVGNRSTKTATSAAGTDSTSYTYDTADRLTQEQTTLAAGGTRTTNYTWDQNGNLSAKTETGKATLYRFDPNNRLIDIRTGATPAAAQAASPSVSYAYDAGGNRIRKASPSGTSSYLIDGTQAYPQVALESTATTSTAYVWGNQLIRQTQGGAGNLFATANAANDVFPLQGHLNTSLGALDANGNVVEQSLSDAFGQLDTPNGLKQNHLLTGQYWDQDAQLVYLRARWYDPRTGRFVSADPYPGAPRKPITLNRYAYADADPVHRVDPSGMYSSIDISISMETLIGTASTMAPNFARVAATQMSRSILGSQAATMAGAATIIMIVQACRNNPMMCWFDIPVLVTGSEMPSTSSHIAEAELGFGSTKSPDQFNPLPFLLNRQPRNAVNYDVEPQCNRAARGAYGPPSTCDEYPFASTRQGGQSNYDLGKVSLQLVPRAEQFSQGNLINWFYNSFANISPDGVSPSSAFISVAIPFLPSFGIDRKGKVQKWR